MRQISDIMMFLTITIMTVVMSIAGRLSKCRSVESHHVKYEMAVIMINELTGFSLMIYEMTIITDVKISLQNDNHHVIMSE